MIIFQLEWYQELKAGTTDIVFIGVFSSRQSALDAIEQVRGRERFVHHPDGFYISDIEVDKDYSTTGFFIPDD